MVDTIKRLCKEKKTTIAAIERACGFGNGSIRKWDSASPAYERIKTVADFLGVSVSEITSEQKENPALQMENGFDADTKELFDIWNSEDEAGRKALIELARFLKSKREK